MSSTFKELEQLFGVSRNAIRKWVDDDFKAKYITSSKDEHNRQLTLISDDGVAELNKHYNVKLPEPDKQPKVESKSDPIKSVVLQPHQGDDNDSAINAAIEALTKQLEAKDKQIADMNESLKTMSRAVDQSQQLQLRAENRAEQAELKLSDLQSENKKLKGPLEATESPVSSSTDNGDKLYTAVTEVHAEQSHELESVDEQVYDQPANQVVSDDIKGTIAESEQTSAKQLSKDKKKGLFARIFGGK